MKINELVEEWKNADRGGYRYVAFKIHANMMALHIKALSAHCECLGMNAENMIAACTDKFPPYSDDAYLKVMQKWELMDELGKPII